MKKKLNAHNRLAVYMLISMILGIAVGLAFTLLRESLGADSDAWRTINNLLFQDITAEGAENAVGIFYILGQMFLRCLQLVIVPMVFCSIVLSIGSISDAATLGRVSAKTFGWFLLTTVIALLIAGSVGWILSEQGVFAAFSADGVPTASGGTGTNPLQVLLDIVPANITSVFSVNTGVLSIVFLAVCGGLAMHKLKLGPESAFHRFCTELNDIIVTFLRFVVEKIAPFAIFMLLCRTFATYGISYLKPAASYLITVCLLLLIQLFVIYPLVLSLRTRLNPFTFIKKIFRVMLFAFSTSSSAATLPLNEQATVRDLGVDGRIASYVLPLGMTVHMDGTAMMQIVAILFIAGTSGFDIPIPKLGMILLLTLIASVGTPASPGAGSVVMFSILTGMGIMNDAAMTAYALILAINRPVEMLLTSVNVVGDSMTAILVARSEGKFDENVYRS